MDWARIWRTPHALSLSAVDLFSPRSHFSELHLEVQRTALHLRQTGMPWQKKLKCCFLCVCAFFHIVGLICEPPPPPPLSHHSIVRKKILGDLTLGLQKNRLPYVSSQGMDEKLTFTSNFFFFKPWIVVCVFFVVASTQSGRNQQAIKAQGPFGYFNWRCIGLEKLLFCFTVFPPSFFHV